MRKWAWTWLGPVTSEVGSTVLASRLPIQLLSASWLGACSSLGVICLLWFERWATGKRRLTFLPQPGHSMLAGFLVKKRTLQLMGLEHTVAVQSCQCACEGSPSEQIGNTMTVWEKLQKRGKQFIFQCLWHFFLLFEQETLYFHFALRATNYVTSHGHGCQVSSMVLHLISLLNIR